MNGAAPKVMVERVGYGAAAILLIVLLFLADLYLAKASADPDRLFDDAAPATVVTTLVHRGLHSPLGDLVERGSIIHVMVFILALAASREALCLARAAGMRPFDGLVYLMVSGIVLTPWFSAVGWLGHSPRMVEGLFWPHVTLAAAILGVAVLAVARRRPNGAFRDGGVTLLIIFYTGFLASFAVQLRCGRNVPGQEGAWLLLVTVLVTKASDIGAYFVGTTMGRHHPVPGISPGKSTEGMAGGLGASAAVSIALAATGWISSFSVGTEALGFSSWWGPLLFGLAMSTTGQVGDLFESCLKREGGKKDSGEIIPRFGGILDLIDSPLLAVPVAWFLLTVAWQVV